MSGLELGLFLAGGVAILALTVWSLRIGDLEQRGRPSLPLLFGLHSALLFAVFAVRAAGLLPEMSDPERLAAGLIAGCFSSAAILMLARAFRMRQLHT